MMPPTYLTCLEVGQHASPAEVLEAAEGRTVEMFTPAVEGEGEAASMTVPERLWPLAEARITRG
jgi:hypothetical protein